MIHAVDDVSFSLYPGRVTALVGESGSGKSTIARLLDRLHPVTTGSIFFHGEDIVQQRRRRDLLRYRAEVQMIFQDPFGSLNPVKRVDHHLIMPLRLHRIVPRDQITRRVHELLTTVGLVPADEVAAKYPHQLSGGQRQRVNIARALAVEPQVLLADEPISMLDVSIRIGILNLMLDLKRRRNIAFLYITHDIASARYVADEILVLYAGQVVEQGETERVLQNPLHPYTRLLLSAVPNPEAGVIKRARVEARGEVRTVVDPPDGCRFYGRCPVATELSPCITPRLTEVEPGHLVRCHLYPGSQPEG
jgi:peptide/nickel transport system ATP-binding protein